MALQQPPSFGVPGHSSRARSVNRLPGPRGDLTFHARAVQHPVTEEQTVTRRFYLARAPRSSPGRAKDRRSRPEHDRSPRDQGRVAPIRGLRRRAGAFGPPNPRSVGRAHASRRSASSSHRMRRRSVASPRSQRCPAATVARGLRRSGGVQAGRRHTRLAPSSTPLSRDGVAWRARNRRSRGGRGHCARQNREGRALTAERRARHRPPRSLRPLRSRRAPRLQGGVARLCSDLVGCGARRLRW